MNKRITVLLAALVLLLASFIPASAAAADALPAPDLTEKGSLELTMDVDGVILDSGKLHLYQVATLVPMGGVVYDFQLLDVLSAAGATLDTEDLYDGAQSERLLAAAQNAMPNGYMATPIADGKARFENLDAGLYLVWQDKAGACEGYDPIHPFLISVPRLQDGAYTMHVVADPKVPLHTEPTPPPPPPPPPPPDIPQTGQMNWPIPVMAVAGTVLLVIGCILLAGRKRAGHEE